MAKSRVHFVPLKLSANVSIAKKRVKQANGKTISLRSVDTESPKFDAELSAIFAKNVAKARRENSALSPKIVRMGKLPGLNKVETVLLKTSAGEQRKRKPRPNKNRLKAHMAG